LPKGQFQLLGYGYPKKFIWRFFPKYLLKHFGQLLTIILQCVTYKQELTLNEHNLKIYSRKMFMMKCRHLSCGTSGCVFIDSSQLSVPSQHLVAAN